MRPPRRPQTFDISDENGPRVVGMFPNDRALIRLATWVAIEQIPGRRPSTKRAARSLVSGPTGSSRGYGATTPWPPALTPPPEKRSYRMKTVCVIPP